MNRRGSLAKTPAPDRLPSLVALIAIASLAGCSIGSGLDDALSVDADEMETASRSPEFPEIPEGVEMLRAVWYEDDPSITATDINDETTRALRDAGADVTCEELPPRPDSQVPVYECSFVWTDGREGTYTLEGGGPVPEDQDVDGIAIALNATYPQE